MATSANAVPPAANRRGPGEVQEGQRRRPAVEGGPGVGVRAGIALAGARARIGRPLIAFEAYAYVANIPATDLLSQTSAATAMIAAGVIYNYITEGPYGYDIGGFSLSHFVNLLQPLAIFMTALLVRLMGVEAEDHSWMKGTAMALLAAAIVMAFGKAFLPGK